MSDSDQQAQAPGHDIPGTLLLDREVNQDPYPFYDRLRRQAPVWRVPGANVVAVTSSAAIVDLLSRPQDFSNVVRNLIYRGDDGLPQQMGLGELTVEALASSDPPIHTVHRKAVFPELVARKMAELEGDIDELARARVDALLAQGGGDFMEMVANPIPISVVSRLIGFQDYDPTFLLQAAFDSTQMVGATSSLDEITTLVERTVDVAVWIDGEVQRGDAGDDTLLGTVARGIAAGDLEHAQGVTILHTLLSAGGESTTSLIGNAVRILAEQPELQTRLRTDPDLIPTFVEEALRLESPFRQQMRSTPADTTLGGVEIPAGTTLFAFFAAANRDPEVYDAPDEVRLDRETPKHHLAFGRGLHFCVGAPLARLEARVVLAQLLARTSSVTLDATSPPRWNYSLLARRHDALPLIVAG